MAFTLEFALRGIGPQFIAKDLKEFIRVSGMTHVRTSPYYPNRTEKSNVGTSRSKESASAPERRCPWKTRGEHYNNVRLNSAIGYITPNDMLAGRQIEIHAEHDRKLEAERKQRQIRRQRRCEE